MSELTGLYGSLGAQAARDAAALNPFNTALANIKTSKDSVKVAREFEAAFLGQMLQPMFTNIDAASPFSGGAAEQTFRPMLINEFANALSAKGGVGVADAVLREMVRIQMAQGEIAGLSPLGVPLAPAENKPDGAH
jgi:flagellar protein FlgJ